MLFQVINVDPGELLTDCVQTISARVHLFDRKLERASPVPLLYLLAPLSELICRFGDARSEILLERRNIRIGNDVAKLARVDGSPVSKGFGWGLMALRVCKMRSGERRSFGGVVDGRSHGRHKSCKVRSEEYHRRVSMGGDVLESVCTMTVCGLHGIVGRGI